jgi:hypothetical protein
MPVVNTSTGAVNHAELDAIRDHLRAAKAPDVLAVIASYDAARALRERLRVEGHEAHRRPDVARRRHHDLCVHDVLAGREPGDAELWADVAAADDALERAKARYAAADDALQRARRALGAALGQCWPTVLPYLARERAKRPAGCDVLYRAIGWPALVDPPGVETQSEGMFHFAAWWPLSWEAMAPDRQRPDRVEWNEWAWSELAAGNYDAGEMSITLRNTWTPEPLSAFAPSRDRVRLQPVVIITPERVAAHEDGLARRK